MTKFSDDLLRYLDETPSDNYNKMAEEFFFGEADYWAGTHWKTKEPFDDTPEHFKNMNVDFSRVADYGGEDMGSEYWKVYKFTDKNTGEEVYIKFDGWYASYEGAEYTEMSIVQPVVKTVTVYE